MSIQSSPDFDGFTNLTGRDTQNDLQEAIQAHTGSSLLNQAELLFPIHEELPNDKMPPVPPINAPIEADVDGVRIRGWARWLQEGTLEAPTLRLAALVERSDLPGAQHDFEFHTIPDTTDNSLRLEKYLRLKPDPAAPVTPAAEGLHTDPLAQERYAAALQASRILARQLDIIRPGERETQQLIEAIKKSRHLTG